MAYPPIPIRGTDAMNSTNAAAPSYMPALVVLTSLFFMWGLITSLNDILIPHLKAIFTLSYVQAMLIQFCFFGAYFVMSLPSGFLVEKLGYRKGIIIGLATAGVGCLGFYPAASLQSYPLFLGALFVLASGITLLQVAANPYVAILGQPETAASRLKLTQAFNSLGTTIGPFLGSVLILAAVTGDARRMPHARSKPCRGRIWRLAAVLFLIAIVFAQFKLPIVPNTDASQRRGGRQPLRSVWRYSHLVLGAVAIFMYVGAEVAIGSFLVNFMAQPEIGGLTESVAGRYLSLYWGGAMVGRFIGSYVLRKIKPGYVLALQCRRASILLLDRRDELGAAGRDVVRARDRPVQLDHVPDDLHAGDRRSSARDTGEGSGVLCMAIVGGAIVPVIQGYFADHHGHSHVVLRAGGLLRVHRVLRVQGVAGSGGRVTPWSRRTLSRRTSSGRTSSGRTSSGRTLRSGETTASSGQAF